MKNILLLFSFLLLLSTNVIAQCKIITYSHNMQYSSAETEHVIEKKILFDNNRGLSFHYSQYYVTLNPVAYIENDSIAISATLFDRVNDEYKHLSVFVDTLTQKNRIQYNIMSDWSSVSSTLKNQYKGENMEMFLAIFPDSSFNLKRKLKVRKTKEIKEINGYSCKLVLVSEYGKEYSVWYTDEFNYNWLFLNFIYELPGTVIRIEQNNKIRLELLSINELNFDKIPFEPIDLFEILCKWD